MHLSLCPDPLSKCVNVLPLTVLSTHSVAANVWNDNGCSGGSNRFNIQSKNSFSSKVYSVESGFNDGAIARLKNCVRETDTSTTRSVVPGRNSLFTPQHASRSLFGFKNVSYTSRESKSN